MLPPDLVKIHPFRGAFAARLSAIGETDNDLFGTCRPADIYLRRCHHRPSGVFYISRAPAQQFATDPPKVNPVATRS